MTRLLKKLKANGAISQETYKDLLPSGSRPGILYGLPKVHKENCPIRPIISAVGSFNHKLARFLVEILSFLSMNEYTIRNSFTFLDELRSLTFDHDVYMCSFDVVSLFTNVPLDETIHMCTDACDRLERRIDQKFPKAALRFVY